MAKMRVHELAKELEIKSQEIIESLSGTEYEIKSASSNIDDAAQEIIRKKYKKAAATVATTPQGYPCQILSPRITSKIIGHTLTSTNIYSSPLKPVNCLFITRSFMFSATQIDKQ